MKTVYTIARILEGLIFGVIGLNGFIFFLPNPPTIPHEALTFFTAIVSTHYSYFVFAVQVIAGLLLLVNRYVVLALVLLAGVITNVLTFHITMWPASLIPMPALVTVLWFILAWCVRPYMAPIFVKQVEVR